MRQSEKIASTILLIPHGKVASYGQIADLAGLPGRARLVGRVLRQAPKALKLPWHRVLRSSGQLAFERLSEQARKQSSLLQGEGVQVNSHRVNLQRFQWQPSLDDILLRLTH